MAQKTLKGYILLNIFILLLSYWASAQDTAQPSDIGGVSTTVPGTEVENNKLLSDSQLKTLKSLGGLMKLLQNTGKLPALLKQNPGAGPLIRKLSKNGDIRELVAIPEVMKKLLQPGGLQKFTKSDLQELASDPTVQKVLNSSDLQELLKSSVLEKLLKSATAKKKRLPKQKAVV